MPKTLAAQFERFTADCLSKQTPKQIADARLLFYAGALAAVDAIHNALGPMIQLPCSQTWKAFWMSAPRSNRK